ncbi:hypothetical protein BDW59DRAFT_167818 [Aspergillus cavernicola]|uniref:Thioesterase domain-containing protein n=1 Tax=Aspergillus cavernicola TaxID=176166 RepID=A0ABR4HAH4_9EURO
MKQLLSGSVIAIKPGSQYDVPSNVNREQELAYPKLPVDDDTYPGKLHGGMSAFLLDHMLAKSCQPAVTANLNISYLQPITPDVPLTLRVWHNRIKGRKKYMGGSIFIRDDRTGRLTEAVRADALFIEPEASQKQQLED